MKSKKLLRFYFGADKLESALNNLITHYAICAADGVRGGEFYAEKICAVIGKKDCLGGLWEYLDGVISGLGQEEREVLKRYAFMRTGIRGLGEKERRGIKRAVIKFVRHARGIDRFREGIGLVNELYCLI